MSEKLYSQEELENIIHNAEIAISEAEQEINAKSFIVDTCKVIQLATKQSEDTSYTLGFRHRREHYAETTTVILNSLLKN